MFKAGLAQTRGQIHQTRTDDLARSVDDLCGFEAFWRRADGSDSAVHDKQRLHRIEFLPDIDQAAIVDLNIHAPTTVAITAMRTAIPKVTCGSITLCRPSATGESISTPRFIGPGCMTMASGFARASFAAVSP